jgi:type VI secretion system secreted protein VgrG
MRLGRPYGGDVFGFHFPLLDGTEVAVAFEGGDPDRPYIAHVMHDGSHPDLVTNRNDTRNVIRTAASNKIRLEDRRGRNISRFPRSTARDRSASATWSMPKGKAREGVEARTDDWMALRAAKGYITTEAQRARGPTAGYDGRHRAAGKSIVAGDDAATKRRRPVPGMWIPIGKTS